MAYPSPFHRLVLIGTIYGDIWNTTVSLIPTIGTPPPVSQMHLDLISTTVGQWFPKTIANGGLQFSPNVKLTSIKLNRIDVDGHYMDPDAMEKTYATPISGGGTYNGPPQLTIAATLRGANDRALAGRGRMYFPLSENCQTVASDGRLQAAQSLAFATNVKGLMANLDQAYLANSIGCKVGVASKTRGGAFQALHQVTVGRVVDTMRSRRSSLAEDPQPVTYP